MADTFVISGLRRKRAHLAGEIDAAQRTLAKQREALATLDAVIRLFEPASNPELIPAIRPVQQRCPYFRRGEQTRLCAEALREAGTPRPLAEIAAYAMAAKGLEGVEARVQARITEHIRQTLGRMEGKGTVRRIVRWPDVWWELAV
jgi:hypothetical protein